MSLLARTRTMSFSTGLAAAEDRVRERFFAILMEIVP